MICLLDTSALLAHYRDEPGADGVQEIFDRDGSEVFLSSVSLAEMARRLRELAVPEPRIWEIIEAYEGLASDVVTIDAGIARRADEIALRSVGRLPLADALIAACAMSRSAVLVHRDAHMRSIPSDALQQFDLGAASA